MINSLNVRSIDRADGVELVDPSFFGRNCGFAGASSSDFNFELYFDSSLQHGPIDFIEIFDYFSSEYIPKDLLNSKPKGIAKYEVDSMVEITTKSMMDKITGYLKFLMILDKFFLFINSLLVLGSHSSHWYVSSLVELGVF